MQRTFLSLDEALTIVAELSREASDEIGDNTALLDQHAAVRRDASAAVPQVDPDSPIGERGRVPGDVSAAIGLMVIHAALSAGQRPVELCVHVGSDPDEALRSPRPVIFSADPLYVVCVDCAPHAEPLEPLECRFIGECDLCGARPDDHALTLIILQAGQTVVHFAACAGCVAWTRSLSDVDA